MKKIVLLPLILGLSFAFTSCGDNKKDDPTPPPVDTKELILDNNEINAVEFETFTIGYTLKGLEGNPTWITDNPTVATVDLTGMVETLVPGTANITASIGEIKATCKINVSKSTESAVMYISDTSIQLEASDSYQISLYATYKNILIDDLDFNVSYSTLEDSEIAELSYNKNSRILTVNAKKSGSFTATVFATTKGTLLSENIEISVL